MLAGNKKVRVLTDKHIVEKLVKPKQLQTFDTFLNTARISVKSEVDLQPITGFKDCPLAFELILAFPFFPIISRRVC